MNFPVRSRFIDIFNDGKSFVGRRFNSLSINVDIQFFFYITVSHLLQNVQQITALMVEHATRIMESRPAGNYIPLNVNIK